MKLFVGNLSWNATEDDLHELFSSVGEVESIRIIVDPQSGRSRGFGFVQMKQAEHAAEAIRQFNDKPFQGRPMSVGEAKEPAQRPARSNSDRNGAGRPNRSYNNRYSQ